MVDSSGNIFEWLQKPEGRVFNNLGFPNMPAACRELVKIRGEDLIETAWKSGGKVAIFDSKSQHFAFHNTTISQKHPSLGDRDLIAEIISAARKRGMVYVPYIPVDADMRAWRENPDWRPVNAEGGPLVNNNPHLCFSSPFRQFIVAYLGELAANYEIGGLWMDGVGFHTAPTYCYCTYCRQAFRDRYGQEMPVDPMKERELWLKVYEYRIGVLRDMLGEIKAITEKVKPGIPLLGPYIWFGSHSGSSWKYLDRLDMAWIESAWFGEASALQYLRAASGKPIEYYIPTFQYAPNYPMALPTAELRSKAMSAISHGAMPTFTLWGRPELLKPVQDELAQRSEWVANAEPVPYCGIVFSETSMQACEPDTFPDLPHFTSYGTVSMLLEDKIVETYVSDRQLLSGDLSQYAVLVLSDILHISDPIADRIRQYVRDGGSLVATFRTSLYDSVGQQMNDFGLADLLGVHYRGELELHTQLEPYSGNQATGQSWPNRPKCKFLTLSDHAILDHPIIQQAHAFEVVPGFRSARPADSRLFYPDPMLKAEPDADTQMVLWEEVQQPGYKWPLITTRQYGKGRVVYIAADLGMQYSSPVTFPFIRKLLTNSVRFAAQGKPAPVEVNAPLFVQTTLFSQKNPQRLIVHLLNEPKRGTAPFTRQRGKEFGGYQRILEEVIPVYDIEVRIFGRYGKVYLAPGRVELESEFRNGYTCVKVRRLDSHAMVVAEL